MFLSAFVQASWLNALERQAPAVGAGTVTIAACV